MISQEKNQMTSSILISKMKQHAFVVILALVCGRAAAQPKPPNAIDRPIMAAGAGHALIIKSDGTVWSWGVNGQGQLGRGPADTGVTFEVVRRSECPGRNFGRCRQLSLVGAAI